MFHHRGFTCFLSEALTSARVCRLCLSLRNAKDHSTNSSAGPPLQASVINANGVLYMYSAKNLRNGFGSMACRLNVSDSGGTSMRTSFVHCLINHYHQLMWYAQATVQGLIWLTLEVHVLTTCMYLSGFRAMYFVITSTGLEGSLLRNLTSCVTVTCPFSVLQSLFSSKTRNFGSF